MRIIVDENEAMDLEASRVERKLRRRRSIWRGVLGVLATAGVVGTGAFVALAQTSPGPAHGHTQAKHHRGAHHHHAGAPREAKPADPAPQEVAIVPPSAPTPTATPMPGETTTPSPAPATRPAPTTRPRTTTRPAPSAAASAPPRARPSEGLPIPVPSIAPPAPQATTYVTPKQARAPVRSDLDDSYNYGVPEIGTLPGQVSPAVPNPAQALQPSLPRSPVFTPNALPGPAGGFLGGQ